MEQELYLCRPDGHKHTFKISSLCRNKIYFRFSGKSTCKKGFTVTGSTFEENPLRHADAALPV